MKGQIMLSFDYIIICSLKIIWPKQVNYDFEVFYADYAVWALPFGYVVLFAIIPLLAQRRVLRLKTTSLTHYNFHCRRKTIQIIHRIKRMTKIYEYFLHQAQYAFYNRKEMEWCIDSGHTIYTCPKEVSENVHIYIW